jgi:hypothetical protein
MNLMLIPSSGKAAKARPSPIETIPDHDRFTIGRSSIIFVGQSYQYSTPIDGS